MGTRRNRLTRDTSGAAAVEAAIIFPVLILMGFGAIDGSYMVLQNHRIEAGLTAGGSYLSRTPASARQDAIAKNIAIAGTPTGGTSRVNGWTAADVTVTYRAIDTSTVYYRGGPGGQVAELTTSLPYRGFGFIRGVSGGRARLSARYETRVGL